MTEERYRQLDEFDYAAGTTLTLAGAQAVKLGTTIGNIGLEGVAYDPATSGTERLLEPDRGYVTANFCQGFVVVKEKQPEDIFQTNARLGLSWIAEHGSGDRHGDNGGPGANEGTANAPTSLVPPSDANVNDFSDVFAMSNIASLHGTDAVSGADGTHYDGDLLIDSQESGAIELIDRNGDIKSRLDLWPNPSSGLDVVDETHEGVAMDQLGNLYVDSEDGAGPTGPSSRSTHRRLSPQVADGHHPRVQQGHPAVHDDHRQRPGQAQQPVGHRRRQRRDRHRRLHRRRYRRRQPQCLQPFPGRPHRPVRGRRGTSLAHADLAGDDHGDGRGSRRGQRVASPTASRAAPSP